MIRLYGRADSTNVRKVLWYLAELNLQFEHIPAGGSFGITDTAEYRKLNPNGLVPCLTDEDLVLWESHSILRYLNEKYADKNPFKANFNYKYETEKWLDWCLSTLTPVFRALILHGVKLPFEARNAVAFGQALTQLQLKLSILDQHLSHCSYLNGAYFSIADIAVASYYISFKKLPLDVEFFQAFYHVEKWFALLSTRVAFPKH